MTAAGGSGTSHGNGGTGAGGSGRAGLAVERRQGSGNGFHFHIYINASKFSPSFRFFFSFKNGNFHENVFDFCPFRFTNIPMKRFIWFCFTSSFWSAGPMPGSRSQPNHSIASAFFFF